MSPWVLETCARDTVSFHETSKSSLLEGGHVIVRLQAKKQPILSI